jgi:hypothetical protein
MPVSKAEAILQAIRNTPVGDEIIIHNSNAQIWCILKIVAKEHKEDEADDGGFVYLK